MRSKLLQARLNLLQPYLDMEGVNEVIFNREKELFLDRNGKFEKILDETFSTEFLISLCEQLAVNRNLLFDRKMPQLSCSIPDSSYRVCAIHPSVTVSNEVAMCIRIPSKNKFPLENFKINNDEKYEKLDETNDENTEEWTYQKLREMIKNKKNVLVSGGTGSGKTSFLNALIAGIDENERNLTIEDSQELSVSNYNKAQLLVAKTDDANFTYENALNCAMRLRPDRIFLGEIDTRNTMLFLRLSNTGHDGMLSTLHANSVDDAIHAITLNAKFAGSDIAVPTLIEYFSSAIDYIIQIKKGKNGRVIDDVLDVKAKFGKKKRV